MVSKVLHANVSLHLILGELASFRVCAARPKPNDPSKHLKIFFFELLPLGNDDLRIPGTTLRIEKQFGPRISLNFMHIV